MGASETKVRISDVKFLNDVEEHSDGEERDHPEVERHEEEEEEEGEGDEEGDEEPEPPVKRGRGRPKKKRGKESPKGKGKAKAKSRVQDVVQVKLNSVLLTAEEDGAWEFELPPGLNVVEVGAKGGMAWRAYLDRIASA